MKEQQENISLNAGVDLSSAKGKLVQVTGDDAIGLADATSGYIGVVVRGETVGRACAVAISGVAMVHAGAAVNAGDHVVSDANGLGITGADKGPIALTSCTAAGQLIRVLLNGNVGT